MALTRDEIDQARAELRELMSRGPQTTQRAQPKQGGGFQPSALISEGGGLGGALGGAALGTAILPGIGTVLGAGIGGFLGGTGGSVVEQNVRDQKVDIGKALREGAIEGITSAGPIKLGKIGFAGAKGLKAAGAKGLTEAVQEAATRPGILSKAGSTLRGEARGIGVGEKLAGRRLRETDVQDLNKFLETTVKVKGGSAARQSARLEKFISQQGDELNKAISKSNRVLSQSEKNKLVKQFQSEFGEGIVGVTPRQQSIADDLTTRVTQAQDIKSLDALRKIVDDNINFARNAASPKPREEQVYKMFRRLLTDEVANKVGAAKGLKDNLANAFRAEELLLNRAVKRAGPAPAGVPIPGRLTQSVMSGAGRAVGGVGRALDTRSLPAVGTRSLLANADLGGAPAQPQEVGLEDALLQGGGLGAGLSTEMSGVVEDQSPYSRENLLFDIQRDPKNADKYMAYYQSLQEIFPSGGDQKQQAKLEGAKSIVDNLMQVYQQVGGPKGAYAGRASSVLGALNVGEGNEQARAYEQNRMSYLTPIIKAFGEVGVLTDKDREVVANAIPSINDTPAQAEQKIGLLYQMLESLGGRGSGQDDLLNALLQQQGAF